MHLGAPSAAPAAATGIDGRYNQVVMPQQGIQPISYGTDISQPRARDYSEGTVNSGNNGNANNAGNNNNGQDPEKLQNALDFITQVKNHFANNIENYNNFLEIMKDFKSEK